MRNRGKLRFQAHRGVSTDFPENTFAAFKAAVDQGYDLIELDPKFTSDNRCVILHDDVINRTGRNPDGSIIPGNVSISSVTLNDVKKFDFGISKSPKFRGEQIPDLEETLQFSKDYGIPLKFDNVMELFSQEQLTVFFDCVKKAEFHSDIGFTCKSIDYMRRVIETFPDAEIHYDGPFDEKTLKTIVSSLKNNRLTVWVGFSSATDEICSLVKKYGELGIWILSSDEQAKKSTEAFHADVIETNGEIKPGIYSRF